MAAQSGMTRLQAAVLAATTLLALLGAPLWARSQINKAEVASAERADREVSAARTGCSQRMAELQANAQAAEAERNRALGERDRAVVERAEAVAEAKRLRGQLAQAADRRVHQRVKLFAAEHFDDHRSPISPYRWDFAGYDVTDWGTTAADGRRSVRLEVRARVSSVVGADSQPRAVFLLDFNGDGELLHWKRTDAVK